jgi:uncharacterized protein YcbX
MPTYTLEEVAKHRTPEDCWVIADGGVYDITKWHHEHPGGSKLLLEHGGEDASVMFKSVGHSEEAIKTREGYRIGDLEYRMEVTHLRRFAVKGLAHDELQSVDLRPDHGFPNDRRWALQFGAQSFWAWLTSHRRFNPAAPTWLHKAHFLCAFTAGELLGKYETNYEDATDTLTVRLGAEGQKLLCAKLTDATQRAQVGTFFSAACGREVHVVSAPTSHHFGNTAAGFKHHPSGSIIHIVSADTVAALSQATGIVLDPSRFRPNLVLGGVPAWSEFEWVGKCVQVGGATLEVLQRTVRCDAINIDAAHGNTAGIDLPALMALHFPEHGPYLGVYARVVTGGTVCLGDKLVVQESPVRKPPGDTSFVSKGAPSTWPSSMTAAVAVGAVLAVGLVFWQNQRASLGARK